MPIPFFKIKYLNLSREEKAVFMEKAMHVTGRSKETIYRWLNGDIKPTPLEREAVVNAYNEVAGTQFTEEELFKSVE